MHLFIVGKGIPLLLSNPRNTIDIPLSSLPVTDVAVQEYEQTQHTRLAQVSLFGEDLYVTGKISFGFMISIFIELVGAMTTFFQM